MARNWIKVETKTVDKPEVCIVATHLRLDPDAVVGKLVRLWSWAEVNRIDGQAMNVTREFIDKLTGKKGFAAALQKAGWLVEDGERLTFPNFSRHNGPQGKGRALTAERVSRHRERKRGDNERDTSSSAFDSETRDDSETKKPQQSSASKHVKSEAKDSLSVVLGGNPEAAVERKMPSAHRDLTVPEASAGDSPREPIAVSAGHEMNRRPAEFESQDTGVEPVTEVASLESDKMEIEANALVANSGEKHEPMASEVEGIAWGAREIDLEAVESVKWEEAVGLAPRWVPADPETESPLAEVDSPDAAKQALTAVAVEIDTPALDSAQPEEPESAVVEVTGAGEGEGASPEEGGGKTRRSRGISLPPKKGAVPDSPDQPLLF
jgi:hypothetical protein